MCLKNHSKMINVLKILKNQSQKVVESILIINFELFKLICVKPFFTELKFLKEEKRIKTEHQSHAIF